MILSLLFDMPFKDWFVGVYMHDLVPMLTDTMNILLSEECVQPAVQAMKTAEENTQEREARANDFAHVLALRNLRQQIARQRRMEQRREQRQQAGETGDLEEEDEDEDESSESGEQDDIENIEIPDNETTRMEFQAMEAQFLQRRNEEGESH